MDLQQAKDLLDKGLYLYKCDQYEEAIKVLEKITIDNVDIFGQAKILLASSFHKLGEIEKCIQQYLEIPKQSFSWYFLAKIRLAQLYQLNKELKKSKFIYKKLLKEKDIENKYLDIIYVGLANIFFQEKNWKKVINYAEKINENSDVFLHVQVNLFEAYLYTKNFEKLKNKFYFLESVENNELYCNYKNGYKYQLCRKIFIKNLDHKFLSILPYIKFILDELIVSESQDNLIAHYTNLTVSKLLLSQDDKEHIYFKLKSPLRLNTINFMNDPEEGCIINKILCVDNAVYTPDLAFISCFTVHHDSLNHFRLYAKEQQEEARGVSLVLSKEFFECKNNHNKMFNKLISHIIDPIGNEKSNRFLSETACLDKMPLYRCIYLDPTSGLIKVAQREEWSFHREYKKPNKASVLEQNPEAEQNWQDYQAEILEIESKVTAHLKELV